MQTNPNTAYDLDLSDSHGRHYSQLTCKDAKSDAKTELYPLGHSKLTLNI
jgi:hypothetical protein